VWGDAHDSGAYPPDMTRGRIGRFLAMLELTVAAIAAFVVVPVLWMTAPGTTGPQPPEWLSGLAVAGLLIGFAWMMRIYRTDPEPEHEAWRYRERD
jgi:hypothetical protein